MHDIIIIIFQATSSESIIPTYDMRVSYSCNKNCNYEIMFTKIQYAQEEEASLCQFCNRSDILVLGIRHHCRACGKVRNIN